MNKVYSIGCSHYKRHCQFKTPCCKKKYVCRLCHDDEEKHPLPRHDVEEIECLVCHTEQKVSPRCINNNCKVQFASYFCSVCRLYDNADKGQFHCEGCGLCRVGGRENFFHCLKCNLCLPKQIRDTHKCVEDSSRGNCAVCLEDLHSSRAQCHVPRCGHLLHSQCFKSLFDAGFFACPTCAQSMAPMTTVWEELDKEIMQTPLPPSLAETDVGVLCKDCHKEGKTLFHPLGLKCLDCGSYNTATASLPASSDEGNE